MTNISKRVEVPDWMNGIITKRRNVKGGLVAFIGVLRKRFVVGGAGRELIGGKLPLDLVRVLSKWIWITRFDARWGMELKYGIKQ